MVKNDTSWESRNTSIRAQSARPWFQGSSCAEAAEDRLAGKPSSDKKIIILKVEDR
jgi:hypothetical protein